MSQQYVYTSRMTIAVPVALCPVAAPIAQAFDPASGGAATFDSLRATDANGNIWAMGDSPCTPETAAGLPYLQSTPGLLHQRVTQDFAARWPDQTPPTLAECETFRQAIKVVVGLPYHEALAAMGLTAQPN